MLTYIAIRIDVFTDVFKLGFCACGIYLCLEEVLKRLPMLNKDNGNEMAKNTMRCYRYLEENAFKTRKKGTNSLLPPLC